MANKFIKKNGKYYRINSDKTQTEVQLKDGYFTWTQPDKVRVRTKYDNNLTDMDRVNDIGIVKDKTGYKVSLPGGTYTRASNIEEAIQKRQNALSTYSDPSENGLNDALFAVVSGIPKMVYNAGKGLVSGVYNFGKSLVANPKTTAKITGAQIIKNSPQIVAGMGADLATTATLKATTGKTFGQHGSDLIKKRYGIDVDPSIVEFANPSANLGRFARVPKLNKFIDDYTASLTLPFNTQNTQKWFSGIDYPLGDNVSMVKRTNKAKGITALRLENDMNKPLGPIMLDSEIPGVKEFHYTTITRDGVKSPDRAGKIALARFQKEVVPKGVRLTPIPTTTRTQSLQSGQTNFFTEFANMFRSTTVRDSVLILV